ncbi:hypothetical protein ElyMa_006620300 [Elysia marginata]|uniref:Uncharacterized protein n=1 Tax=Elysia marginata TaxID=1093978 RepID=A0AAV4IKL6_9GAST|nr:hypothetical protein ElyMa_006620300 [Elysia marginata]
MESACIEVKSSIGNEIRVSFQRPNVLFCIFLALLVFGSDSSSSNSGRGWSNNNSTTVVVVVIVAVQVVAVAAVVVAVAVAVIVLIVTVAVVMVVVVVAVLVVVAVPLVVVVVAVEMSAVLWVKQTGNQVTPDRPLRLSLLCKRWPKNGTRRTIHMNTNRDVWERLINVKHHIVVCNIKILHVSTQTLNTLSNA